MVGLAAVVMFGIIGLAVDVGRLFVARAELQRAVDAAALAGVVELPDTTKACDVAKAYMIENEPNSNPQCVFPQSNQLKITGSKTVNTIFVRVLGIDSADVGSKAVAGFGIAPVDAYMAIDATGSMGASPCNGSQNNSGCPIYEAKNAAKKFTDTLLADNGNGYTLVGAGAFRGCYIPTDERDAAGDEPARSVEHANRDPARLHLG